MQPHTDGDFKKLFTELIKKQMVVLGPDITMAKVKNVPGIVIDEKTGEVISIQGDGQALLQNLINQFVELSGLIVKKTMESILSNYPGLMTIATNGQVEASVPESFAATTSAVNGSMQNLTKRESVMSDAVGNQRGFTPEGVKPLNTNNSSASSEDNLAQDQIDALNKIFQTVEPNNE